MSDRAALRARIEALGPWFHNLDLDGVATAPDHFIGDYPGDKFRRIAHALPADLGGRTVLDIGCNAGFYAFELARRGAAEVVGIDEDERYLAQARLAAEVLGAANVSFERLSVYDVAALGRRFDVVVFMGVLYHLRHPLLALDLIHAHAAGDLLIFQSLQRGSTRIDPVEPDYPFEDEAHFRWDGYPKLHFVEGRYAGDPTNWWIPNRACAEAMLRASGFAIEAQPEGDVYICRRVALPGAGGRAVHPAQPTGRQAT